MMAFLNSTESLLCNVTIGTFVQNLTSSYTDQRNEASMVATSVLMFLLAALFFNLNLFSRQSDISAILNPSIRLFLSASLSIFLPVMSYLFSEAKNEDAASYYGGSAASSGQSTELSLRARTILMWMLLVELLRKKVEAILVTEAAGMQWYSGTIERAARITWLGILVFFNVKGAGHKATYSVLWVLAATKLVQRVTITELGKRSFAYGKNAQLLASYMAQMLQQKQRDGRDQEEHNEAGSSNGRPSGSKLLEMCNYAVMGEENLVLEKEAGPQGYHLELKEIDTDSATAITVGKIWRLAESDELLQGDAGTKRLCLSFALYKLLRRRFEDLPITGAETRDCRRLIFRGLCDEGGTITNREDTSTAVATITNREDTSTAVATITNREDTSAVALFQVLDNELQFLCEYYHSVHPVVLANPFFFLANYILFPITVWALCILSIVLCGNGDVPYAFHSIKTENYAISVGIMRMVGCLLKQIIKSPPALFSLVDLSITTLLFLTFLYEEVWDFLVFILSNWLMVSLICDYTAERRCRESPVLRGIIRRILWVRGMMSHPNLCFKQFSVLSFFRMSLTLPTNDVPKEVKKSVMEYLVAHIDSHEVDAAPLSNGWSTLQLEKHRQYRDRLSVSWACKSESVAEVILTWHIATSLLEVRYPQQRRTALGPERKVARMLSRYLAYLVAFCPELLPDDKEGTERVYKDMNKELEEKLGRWRYYLSPQRVRYTKLMEIAGRQVVPELETTTAVQKGARLGKILIDEAAKNDKARTDVWILLANVWTELMVYVAPSSGEKHVKAHKEALARGGEFVTVLWALATHTGITRPAVSPWEAAAAASRAACV